jgi:hypothetical protein
MSAITNKLSQLTGLGKGKVLVKADNDVVICAAVRTAITKVRPSASPPATHTVPALLTPHT